MRLNIIFCIVLFLFLGWNKGVGSLFLSDRIRFAWPTAGRQRRLKAQSLRRPLLPRCIAQHAIGLSPAGHSSSTWHARILSVPANAVKNKDSRPYCVEIDRCCAAKREILSRLSSWNIRHSCFTLSPVSCPLLPRPTPRQSKIQNRKSKILSRPPDSDSATLTFPKYFRPLFKVFFVL
jgi:hypothetical protein